MELKLELLSEEQKLDLLITALEGGSNYWYYLNDLSMLIVKSDFQTPLVNIIWETVKNGVEVPVFDKENKSEILGKISLENIDKAEVLMATQFKRHYIDAISDRGDATTADIWFQLVVMQKIIFA